MEYCYIITFKPTGQMYIGSRTCKNADPSEFWNSKHKSPYFTSSTIVHKLIDEYGADSFKIEPLELFPDGGAYEHETFLLRAMNLANDPNWLNRSNNIRKTSCNNSSCKQWVNNGIDEMYIKIDSPIPPNYTKGRTKKPKRKIGNNKGNKWMNNPATKKNIHVSKDKIEYYTSLGYVLGQSNAATLLKWYNNGITSIYTKSAPDDILWVPGRIINNTQLINITDPRGVSFHSMSEFNEHILINANSIKIDKYIRLELENKNYKITKKIYNNRINLFKHYNLNESCIGKMFSEIGFSFNRNQKS